MVPRSGRGGSAPVGAIEPVAVEVTLVDADPADLDDVLTTGARPLFGFHDRATASTDRARWSEPPRWWARASAAPGRLRSRWSALASGRRRMWKIAAVVLVLLVAGSAVVLGRPQPPAPKAAVPAPAPAAVAGGILADPNANALATLNAPVVDVAIASSTLYVLSTDALTVVDSYTGRSLRQVSLDASLGARLVLDMPYSLIWVIDEGAVPSSVREFDMASLKMTRSVVAPRVIHQAVVSQQDLYLATTSGLFVVASGSTQLTPIVLPGDPPESLAVDPLAGTVLAVTPGPTGRVFTISQDGQVVRPGPVLGITDPVIALMNDVLWVGGISPTGQVMRADVTTMTPPRDGSGAAFDPSLGIGLQLTPGMADMWAYNPTTLRLYCLDNQTGAVLQTWDDITGPIATGGSGPYVATASGVRPLVLGSSCLG